MLAGGRGELGADSADKKCSMQCRRQQGRGTQGDGGLAQRLPGLLAGRNQPGKGKWEGS